MRAQRRESRLVTIAIQIGINAGALWLAAELLGGFDITGWPSLIAMAAILTGVNMFIAPVAKTLGCPLTVLTLGLFILVINTAMLALSVWFAQRFDDIEVALDDFGSAFLAALLVSISSWALNILVGAPLRRALR